MSTSQRAKSAQPEILAAVEFDMQKMPVHIVLSRAAIRERLRELEHPLATVTATSSSTCGRTAAGDEVLKNGFWKANHAPIA
jgi:hypothetical protein